MSSLFNLRVDAAVLVFDITDVESFGRVRSWVAELRQMVRANMFTTGCSGIAFTMKHVRSSIDCGCACSVVAGRIHAAQMFRCVTAPACVGGPRYSAVDCG